MRIELTPIYMREILTEIPAQVNSRGIYAGYHEASGSILLLFDRCGFFSLFCQAQLGNYRQVAQNHVLKHDHLICKPQALHYYFKAYRLRVHMSSLKAQPIWKSCKRSHNWTSTLHACLSFLMCQFYSSTDFYSHEIATSHKKVNVAIYKAKLNRALWVILKLAQ